MPRGRGRIIQEIHRSPQLVDLRRQQTAHFQGAFGPGKSAISGDRRLRSKLVDAFEFFGAYRGVKEKHTKITFDLLRRMARTCEPMAAILQLRCNQVAAFAKVPRYEHDKGFKLTTRDPDTKVRRTETKEMKRLSDFLLTTGFTRNPQRKDNFDFLIRKITRDSLILDAYAIEKVPGLNADKAPISEIWAVDAGTILHAVEEKYHPEIYTEDKGEVAYIQEIDGKIVAEYTCDELAYGIRNPDTDVSQNGYGRSELEYALNTITGILYATQYNRSYFSTNSTPRGIINIVGAYGDEELEGFKRAWRAQLEGTINAWRTPIMAMDQGQGISFIPLDQKGNRDMEYHLWLDFLINVLASLYGVNPVELGFKGYQPAGPSLSEGSKDSEIEQGEDKGLVPLLYNISNLLNSEIIWALNEDFSLQWTGLPSEDKLLKQQYFMNWLTAGTLTVNEVRTEAMDMDKVDGDWGDAPANPQLLQVYMTDKQAEQMANQPPSYGPATQGGPMQPPGNLNPAGGGDDNQPGVGKPPVPPMAPPAPMAKPANLAGNAAASPGRPMTKSLGGVVEIVVDVEL